MPHPIRQVRTIAKVSGRSLGSKRFKASAKSTGGEILKTAAVGALFGQHAAGAYSAARATQKGRKPTGKGATGSPSSRGLTRGGGGGRGQRRDSIGQFA